MPEKSGLNQWNAGGRVRKYGEVYIPIPAEIRKLKSGFFPERDKIFNLEIPSGEKLKAKICQDNGKALMTNPNIALANWLLKDVLQLKERELLTYKKLEIIGIDSVKIEKIDNENFKIYFSKIGSYEKFINNSKEKEEKKENTQEDAQSTINTTTFCPHCGTKVRVGVVLMPE